MLYLKHFVNYWPSKIEYFYSCQNFWETGVYISGKVSITFDRHATFRHMFFTFNVFLAFLTKFYTVVKKLTTHWNFLFKTRLYGKFEVTIPADLSVDWQLWPNCYHTSGILLRSGWVRVRRNESRTKKS